MARASNVRTRRAAAPGAVICLVVTLAAPGALTAQTPDAPPERHIISGRVLDASTEDPIEGMLVVLRDVREADVDRILSQEEGRFFFVVEDPGLYHLAVSRLGYDSTATAEVAVSRGQNLYVEIRVQPAALGLAPITVRAPRTIPFLEASGFFDRMRRGHGDFLTSRDIERFPSHRVSSLLRRVPGVGVRPNGSLYMRGGSCSPLIVLDGTRLRGQNIDDLVPKAWIDGVEVYRGAATVPAQWRDQGVCGVVAFWTKH